MAYLGNTPTSQSFTSNIDYYSGTGSATAFTLSRSVATINDILVVVDNVVQRPTDAYTLSGSVITFTSAPLSGTNNIYVRYMATTTQVVAPAANSVSYSSLTSDMQSNIYGFKNRIMNGGMGIWQRGTSFTVAGSTFAYTADRWVVYSANSSTTVSRNSSIPTGTGFPYSAQVQRTASNTGTSAVFFQQIIESNNMLDLAGQTITLTFWAKAGANFSSGSTGVYINTGTVADQGTAASLGSWTGYTSAATYTFTPTTTWTKYTVTANLSSIALELSTLFFYNPTGTAGADDSLYITGLQLEKGATATNFDYRPYGAEKLLCMRYYEKTYQDDEAPNRVNPNTANALTGVATSTTNIACHWKFSVPKRTSATVQYYSWNGTGAGKWANLSNTDVTVSTPWGAGYTGFARLDSTGLTAGAFYWGFAAADAEL